MRISRGPAQGGGAAGTKPLGGSVPVGRPARETTIFPDITWRRPPSASRIPETETLAEYGGVTVSWSAPPMRRAASLPNRAWARGGRPEIVRGGFLRIATDGDGEVVDLPAGDRER